jgi:hypothetical protein
LTDGWRTRQECDMDTAELESFCLAVAAVMEMRDGDHRRIERRLDDGVATEGELLAWAVMTAGLVKGPAHRPRQLGVEIRQHARRRFTRLASMELEGRRGRNRRMPGGETPLAYFESWLASPPVLPQLILFSQ